MDPRDNHRSSTEPGHEHPDSSQPDSSQPGFDSGRGNNLPPVSQPAQQNYNAPANNAPANNAPANNAPGFYVPGQDIPLANAQDTPGYPQPPRTPLVAQPIGQGGPPQVPNHQVPYDPAAFIQTPTNHSPHNQSPHNQVRTNYLPYAAEAKAANRGFPWLWTVVGCFAFCFVCAIIGLAIWGIQAARKMNREYQTVEVESAEQTASKLRQVTQAIDDNRLATELEAAGLDAAKLTEFLVQFGKCCRTSTETYGPGFLSLVDQKKYAREIIRNGNSGYTMWERDLIDSFLPEYVLSPFYFDHVKLVHVEPAPESESEYEVWAFVSNVERSNLSAYQSVRAFRFWISHDSETDSLKAFDWQNLDDFCRDAYTSALCLAGTSESFAYNQGLETLGQADSYETTRAESAVNMIRSVADNRVPMYMMSSYRIEVARSLLDFGQTQEALDLLAQLPDFYVTPGVLHLQAIAYEKLEQPDEVLETARLYRARFGLHPAMELLKMEAQLALGNTSSALETGQALSLAFPEFPAALARLASLPDTAGSIIRGLQAPNVDKHQFVAGLDWDSNPETLLAVARQLQAIDPLLADRVAATAHQSHADVDLQYELLLRVYQQDSSLVSKSELYQAALYCRLESDLLQSIDEIDMGDLFDYVLDDFIYEQNWEYDKRRLTSLLDAYRSRAPKQFRRDIRAKLWQGIDQISRGRQTDGYALLEEALVGVDAGLEVLIGSAGRQAYAHSAFGGRISESEVWRARDLLYEYQTEQGANAVAKIWNTSTIDNSLRMAQFAEQLRSHHDVRQLKNYVDALAQIPGLFDPANNIGKSAAIQQQELELLRLVIQAWLTSPESTAQAAQALNKFDQIYSSAGRGLAPGFGQSLQYWKLHTLIILRDFQAAIDWVRANAWANAEQLPPGEFLLSMAEDFEMGAAFDLIRWSMANGMSNSARQQLASLGYLHDRWTDIVADYRAHGSAPQGSEWYVIEALLHTHDYDEAYKLVRRSSDASMGQRIRALAGQENFASLRRIDDEELLANAPWLSHSPVVSSWFYGDATRDLRDAVGESGTPANQFASVRVYSQPALSVEQASIERALAAVFNGWQATDNPRLELLASSQDPLVDVLGTYTSGPWLVNFVRARCPLEGDVSYVWGHQTREKILQAQWMLGIYVTVAPDQWDEFRQTFAETRLTQEKIVNRLAEELAADLSNDLLVLDNNSNLSELASARDIWSGASAGQPDTRRSYFYEANHGDVEMKERYAERRRHRDQLIQAVLTDNLEQLPELEMLIEVGGLRERVLVELAADQIEPGQDAAELAETLRYFLPVRLKENSRIDGAFSQHQLIFANWLDIQFGPR